MDELLERAAALLKSADFPLWEAGAFCYTLLQTVDVEEDGPDSDAYLYLQQVRNAAMEAYCH